MDAPTLAHRNIVDRMAQLAAGWLRRISDLAIISG
jgi:hypothetical protein